MSKMDGITATRLIKTQHPEIVFLGLIIDPKEYQVYAMQKAGAFEVLKKDNAEVFQDHSESAASLSCLSLLRASESQTANESMAGRLVETLGGFLMSSVIKNHEGGLDPMTSDLTRRLDRLSSELRKRAEQQRDEDHKRLLDLTLLVHELSQKVDKLSQES